MAGDAYYAQPRFIEGAPPNRRAVDTIDYTEQQISRLAHFAFQLAQGRDKRLTSMSKWNVLDSSRLWKDVVVEVAAGYPDVELRHEIIDAGAMNLVLHPDRYDVVAMGNMFGDILGDEAAGLMGSLGLIPSAAFGPEGEGLYEPIHGAANDIEGRGIANPIGMVLSAAMMVRHSVGSEAAAAAIETAVAATIKAGCRTADIVETGGTAISTGQMGDEIASRL